MIDDSQTFNISERFLRYERRFFIVFLVTIIAAFLFSNIITGNFESSQLIFAPLVVAFAGLLYVGKQLVLDKLSLVKLHLTTQILIRESPDTMSQKVTFDDVTKLRVREKPDGKVQSVEIYTGKQWRPLMVLYGFEQMSEIVRLIQTQLPSTAQIKTKRTWLDLNNLFVMIPLMTITVLALEFLRQFGTESLRENISSLISLALGVSFLIYGSLSRTFPKFRKWEIVIGLLNLVVGIGGLLSGK